MLYACDARWWIDANGAPDFHGLKITQDKQLKNTHPQWDVKRVEVVRSSDAMLFDRAGQIGWGGNSGFHAINLAAQFGAAKIILVGYDMTLKHGVHWHGKHTGKGLTNPNDGNVLRWKIAIDSNAALLKSLGITVLNCSPVSSLEEFPKMSLKEALAYNGND